MSSNTETVTVAIIVLPNIPSVFHCLAQYPVYPKCFSGGINSLKFLSLKICLLNFEGKKTTESN